MKKISILFIVSMFAFGCNDKAEQKMSEKPKNTEKVLLRLNYEKGTELMLSYDMETTADGGVSVMNKIGLDLKVSDVTAGDNPVYTFAGEVAYIKMESKMMGQNDFYDSSKKVENMTREELEWHDEFESVLHQPMTFSIDSKGKIVKSFEFAEGARSAMEQPLELNNYQVIFPDRPVGIDDTWKGEYKNPLTNNMVKNTYTLKDITPEAVVVSIKSDIPGVAGVMKGNTLEGEYTIDRKTGMLEEGVMHGTLNQMNAKVKYTFTTTIIK